MGRTIIFGDVHGCIRSLKKVLRDAQVTKHDRLISVGDLIHKGPNCAEVVALCRKLNVELVLGNHEHSQLNWMRTRSTNSKHYAAYKKLAEELTAEDVEYLESGRLYIEVPDGIVVHAGLLPKWKTLSDISPRALWVRQLGEGGEFLPLNMVLPTSQFWTNSYDGRFGTVYYGHSSFPNQNFAQRHNNTVGTDLGCVKQGMLLAVSTDGEEWVTRLIDDSEYTANSY